ncbi:DUF4372 domain-containing protein [Macrococcus armenti]|uniref:DUF4372 domain-containing protein n=1 Tax=Macrococcus armenti TaxID=2875764 RepID=UPI001CCF4B25|nr:DUF4372 domain-containing protein [Macrococcus armenti]UBH18032.1 DUF4372 domain-containing protein [Macrococcus armenti]UBH20297.1 DUF4372 domain-containing protein [Macrococcus armenti]
MDFTYRFKKISRQVETLKLDYYTKKLNTCAFIKLLLYLQLFETESLRAVSDSVFSEKLQKTLGFDSISYSQLSRKLSDIPTQVFKDIFSHLLTQIQRDTHFNQKRKVTTPLKIIDSSTLLLFRCFHF